MEHNYRLKEVRIQLENGVTLVADVSSLAGLSQLLKDLKSEKITVIAADETKHHTKEGNAEKSKSDDDTPEHRIEEKAGLDSGTLGKKSLLAFKDGVPQLLRPNALSGTEAVLVLLFAVETGLRTQKIDYESFKGLYEAQNIKIGSPLAMLLTNLRNGSYVDKKAYGHERSIRLSAKGERKAMEVLKSKSDRV